MSILFERTVAHFSSSVVNECIIVVSLLSELLTLSYFHWNAVTTLLCFYPTFIHICGNAASLISAGSGSPISS